MESRIYLPARAPADWQRLLAEPEAHWRAGRSAMELAHAWQGAKGFPRAVQSVLATEPDLAALEVALGLPEHRVPLPPPRRRASQTDLFVLARDDRGLVAIAVEGKVHEPFDDIVSDWLAKKTGSDGGAGKRERLDFLCDQLALPRGGVQHLRYQLLHRAASAVIEARRFHASRALMLVHSFDKGRAGFHDYAEFAAALGIGNAAPGAVTTPRALDGVELRLAWVADKPRTKEERTRFDIRRDAVDARLLALAESRHHVGTLKQAESRPGLAGFLLEDVVQAEYDPPRHFGAKTRLFAAFVYDAFVGGGSLVAHPAQAAAKSVLGVDVYVKPIGWGGTAYVSVWAEPQGQPVLVPFPHVPDLLLKRTRGGSFGQAAKAYRALLTETVSRVNLAWPVALELAARRDA